MAQKKNQALSFLKRSAGPKWKDTTFVYAISRLETIKHRTQNCCKQLITLLDQMCKIISAIRQSYHNYSQDTVVVLQNQSNYVCLLGLENEPVVQLDKTREVAMMYSHFVKQRSQEWFEIRKLAKVTGSTLNSALCLSTVKKQAEHYDNVMNGKAPSEFLKHVRSAMEYGTANEQNTVATIVGKILPVIHPNITFFEVGCYVLHDGGNPLWW